MNDATPAPSRDTFPEVPPLPELREGLLDAAQVELLFADLGALTQVIAILEKGGAQEHAQSGDANLAAARDRLLARQIRAVQVRYLFDGAEWTDTLLHTPAGIRAVRCQHASHSS